MTRRLCVTAVFLLAVALMAGCSINRAAVTVDQTTDLKAIKSMHVVNTNAEGRHIEEIIASKLRAMGYVVTTGLDKKTDADVVVTYIDRWIWDITVYMLELTIVIRDPKSDFPLASGSAFHTSLSRKSPPEMVDEVLANIFKQGGKP